MEENRIPCSGEIHWKRTDLLTKYDNMFFRKCHFPFLRMVKRVQQKNIWKNLKWKVGSTSLGYWTSWAAQTIRHAKETEIMLPCLKPTRYNQCLRIAAESQNSKENYFPRLMAPVQCRKNQAVGQWSPCPAHWGFDTIIVPEPLFGLDGSIRFLHEELWQSAETNSFWNWQFGACC